MHFNRYDIACAWYIYLSENHEGQFSRKYERLSMLTEWFKPSPLLSRASLSDNARAILENIENKWIEFNYDGAIEKLLM